MSTHRSKRSKTVTKWHSKAMLIDPKKTRITIVGSDADEFENRYNMDTRFVTGTTGNKDSSAHNSAENLAIISEIFGTEVTFVLVDN